ncbi:ATP synthase F0 subcomplex A subunit [Humibacillus xanthopallidus]|uniref:ATP synthase subunit a n=1 Tax=Humibacillus xanthopallidus TaxID=412689 RepID=A0A543PSE8_9MICO|nr:F0F1 ATP synthase subunit A [Humibacillus xanthopallidus]TQN46985.1 ATP synthase F0 subcomplex A subunit [Humibacillus xanthopallidus]
MSLVSAAPSEYTAPGVEEFWQPLFGTDGPWAITRPMFLIVISVGLIIWYLLATTRKKALVPSRGQMATEAVYGLVRNGIAKDLIGSKEFMRFVPLLFSLFMIILVNNFFGVMPPFSYPTMSRIGFPIALSLIVWVVFHVVGMKKHGFFGYWKSLVPSGLPKGMILPIFFLELITDLFTRPVTLALRLFGNMFAGHILIVLFITGGWYMLTNGGILVIAGGVTWVFALVMTLFELLVEFLQAYVFTLLAALYIGGAIADEH